MLIQCPRDHESLVPKMMSRQTARFFLRTQSTSVFLEFGDQLSIRSISHLVVLDSVLSLSCVEFWIFLTTSTHVPPHVLPGRSHTYTPFLDV